MSRKTDFLENLFICRSTANHYSNGFRMTARLNRPVDSTLLSNALRLLLVKYPVLAINYFRTDASVPDQKANGSNFEARIVSPILYDDVVSFEKADAFDNDYLKYLSEIDIPVNVEKPTWIVIVTEVGETQYVTFACNHVAFDGNSGVHFVDDLVACLDAAEPSKSELVKVLFDESDAPSQTPPPSTAVTDLYDVSKWYIFKSVVLLLLVPTVVKTFVSSFLVPGHPNLFKHPVFNYQPISHDHSSLFHLVTVSPEKTASILAFCKRNKITLTPLMAACAFKAMDDTFAPLLKIEPSYSFTLDVCGRRYYPELKKETRYGLFMTAVLPVISRNNSVLLGARFISSSLIKALQDRLCFMFAGLLRLVNPWKMIQEQYDKKKTRKSVEVSNLGLVKISHGQWTVQDLIFSQGSGSNHLGLSTVSTPDGGLNVAISCHHSFDRIGDGVVDRFVESLERKLLLESED